MEACDRQSLVVPILGLYGELLRAAHEGIKGGGADMSAVEAFLKEVEKHQDTVFPSKFNRIMWKKNKRVIEEVILFGDLIDRMRARIKNGSMFIPVERGGTESTKSASSDFLRHGASDLGGSNFIRHGVTSETATAVPVVPQDSSISFLRHGAPMEVQNGNGLSMRHGRDVEEA